MGTFHVPVEVGDLQGRRFVRLEALVDTGATYLSVPGSTLRNLGINVVENRTFRLADERKAEYPVGVASVRLDGRTLPVLAVFALEGTSPLLGAVVLETFGLAVDPVARRLVPTPGLLMRFR